MKNISYPPLSIKREGEKAAKRIRAAMGKFCFCGDDWSGTYKGFCTEKDCCFVPKFPWDLSILDEPCPFRGEGSKARIRDTHFISLGLKTLRGKLLTLARFAAIHFSPAMPCFNVGAILEDSAASRFKGGLRWYLTFQGIIPNSYLYAPEEQLALLRDMYGAYEAPLAIEVAMMHVFYFRRCRRHLNPNYYMRCRDRTAQGGWIEIGCSDKDGIEISHSPKDVSANLDIGIGASRRLPKG